MYAISATPNLLANITAWGDSQVSTLTPVQTGFVDYLRTYTGRVVNMRGVGGETSLATLTRFQAEPNLHQDTTIIWTGHNDYSDPPTHIIDYNNILSHVASIISGLGHSRFLVVSIINGYLIGTNSQFLATRNGVALRAAINAQWSSTYGQQYIDILTDFVNFDPTDTDAFAGHYMPFGVRQQDGVGQTHPNATGEQMVARKIADRLTLLGF